MINIILAGVLCLGLSCAPYEKKDKEQISQKDIDKIVAFFDEQICENQNKGIDCYEAWLVNLANQGVDNTIIKEIDYKQQQLLYKSLSENTLNEIWKECKIYVDEGKKQETSLCSNTEGAYISFLKTIGERNKMIDHYANMILESGDFPTYPYPINFLDKEGNLDKTIAEENLKFIIAIHCLYINDINNR